MKKQICTLLDYYPLLFSLITMLYSISLFTTISTLLNIILFFSGFLFFILNIKKINIRYCWLEILFLFILIASCLFNTNTYYFENMKLIILSFLQLIILLNFNIFSTKISDNIKYIINSLIIYSFIISFFSIIIYVISFLFGSPYGMMGSDFTGLYIHPNTAGFIVAISLIFSYIYIRNYRINYLIIINILIQTIILFFSHSNASIIMVITFFIFEFLFYLYKKKKNFYSINILFLANVNIVEIIESLANGRFELWKLGVEIIKNHFYLGVSPAAVPDYAKYYGNISGPSTIDNGGLHNSYIQLIASVGAVGGLLGLLIIIKRLLVAFNYNLRKHLYLSMCLSILLYCFFESKLFFQASFLPTIFWIFLGYIGDNKQYGQNFSDNTDL